MITKKINHGYKKTEIGIIPEDWEIQNILDNSIMKARIGWQGLTTAEYRTDGKFYLVTGTDFINGRINWETCVYVDKKRYDQDKNIQLQNGDILVTKDGTIGKIAYVDFLPLPATLKTGVFVIRPRRNDYVSLFLYYVLTSNYFKEFLKRLTAGSTITHLYQKDFVSFNFIIPSIPEQEKIVKMLSEIDEVIEKINELIKKKMNIKQGAIQELLTGKRRLKGFNEKWNMRTLGSLTTLLTNGFVGKVKDHYVHSDNGVLYIQGYNVEENDFNYHGIKRVSQEFHDQHQKSSLQLGDLLTIQTGDIGVTTIVPAELVGANCHALIISRLKKHESDPRYYCQYFNSAKGKIAFKEIETGSTMKHLNVGDLTNLLLPAPPIEEQYAISEILNDMDLEIKELFTMRKKYLMIKNGMMQKLLIGEIRIK